MSPEIMKIMIVDRKHVFLTFFKSDQKSDVEFNIFLRIVNDETGHLKKDRTSSSVRCSRYLAHKMFTPKPLGIQSRDIVYCVPAVFQLQNLENP